MADFDFAMAVDLDASGAVAETNQLSGSLDKLDTSARKGAGGARELETASRGTANATTGLAQANTRTVKAIDETTRAAIRQQFAVRNAGQQFGDFGLQVATGQDIARSFGQQIGQLGFALSEFQTGPLSKVGAFLVGPWGIAFTVALAVVAPFVERLFQGGEVADKFTDSLKTLAGATAALDEATGRANKSQAESINLSVAATKAKLNEAIALRQVLAARLQDATRPGPITSAAQGAAVGLQQTAAQNAINRNEREIANAQTAIRAADFINIRNRVAAATDKAAAATQRYEATETRLRRQVEAGTLSQKDAEAALLRATIARDAVTKAGRSATSSEGALAGARARLAAATSPLQRAEAELALVRAGAPKNLAAGSEASRAYEARLTAAQAKVNNLRDATREGTKAASEAAKVTRELDAALDRLTRKYAPAIDKANEFREAMADIAKLRAAGKINVGTDVILTLGVQKAQQDQQAKDQVDALRRAYEAGNPGQSLEDGLTGSVVKSIDALREGSRDAGEVFGEGVRGALNDLSSILGDLFPGAGSGKVGRTISAGAKLFDFIGKKGETEAKLGGALEKLSKGVGINADGAATIGKIGGKAIAGAAEGALVNSVFAPIAKGLGLKTSKTGAQIGGAIGSAIPIPGASEVGAIIGSIVGGLFKKTKTGVVTLGNVGGDAAITSTGGNSAGFKKAATALGNGVTDALGSIVDQLGGELGTFSVSIGQRSKKFVVDPTGAGRTKGAGTTKYDTSEEAAAAAIANAIADGAIGGLSDAVQRAVRSTPDVDRALQEALKVKNLEAFIASAADAMKAQFAEFDRAASERVKLARKYGVDVIAVEAANAKARTKLIDDATKASIGSLQDLLTSIASGDLFEGTANDKRTAILGQIGAAKADQAAGVEGAADTLAQLYRSLLENSRDAFGTAGSEYAADRTSTIADAAGIIAAERERIAKAAEQQAAAAEAAITNNKLTDETNTLLAVGNAVSGNILAALQQIAAGGGLAGAAFNIGRNVSLT